MTPGEHHLDAATKYARPARLPVIRGRKSAAAAATLTTFPPQPKPEVATRGHLTRRTRRNEIGVEHDQHEPFTNILTDKQTAAAAKPGR